MLSRIAQGLYELGRNVERAQHVTRILEVNHKMNLQRAAREEGNVWAAISESFECALDGPDERSIYGEIVLGADHPYSVRRCIELARDEGRAMREHISEEMWLLLNETHLRLVGLSFESVLRIGRSEFNRQIEMFGDAFHGLANDTMIRSESWAFLRIGKLIERAIMICKILEIKRKSLALAPEHEGAPVDFHQWQALLRSLSGYEPYRRAFDARIDPEKVLEFVLRRPDFPRSLTCTLLDLRDSLKAVSGSSPVQLQLSRDVELFLEELRLIDTADLMERGSFETELRRFDRLCKATTDGLDLGFFTSLRPASAPLTAAPGASLVPQQ